jgi:hypothetical protein
MVQEYSRRREISVRLKKYANHEIGANEMGSVM